MEQLGDRWLEATDAAIARLYSRLGARRLVIVWVLCGWATALLAATVVALAQGRTARVHGGRLVELLGSWYLLLAVGGAVAVTGSLRMTRFLRPLNGRQAERDPREFASSVLRLPARLAAWNWAMLAVLAIPAAALAAAKIGPLANEGTAVLMSVVASPVGGLAGAFGLQVLCRPILREVLPALDGALPPLGGWGTLRAKLLLGVPGIMVVVVGAVTTLAAPPGTSTSTAVASGFLAMGVTALLVVPMVLILAVSVLQPLRDLVAATDRLNAGDYQTPVAELSGDEYGRLAHSFNQAMRGLAERRGLAQQNERLLEDVRASRARVVAASDAERRRIERNIHDGAQQRLVALGFDMRLLEMRARDLQADEVAKLAERAGADLKAALDELRELACGLHPSVLTTDGLRPALEQLALIAPVPVIIDTPERRYPELIESTLYFVASEALANVAKYADATQAEIRVWCADGQVCLEVMDNGVGGATPRPSSGLAGLADRLAALDGTLVIDSPTGAGTRILAEVPLTGVGL